MTRNPGPERRWLVIPLDQPWRREAACQGLSRDDYDLFFPTSNQVAETGPAKAICARCPVRSLCLDFAIANREEYGIWGGLTEPERRSLRRRRRARAAIH